MKRFQHSYGLKAAFCLWTGLSGLSFDVAQAAPFAFPGFGPTPKKKELKKPKKSSDADDDFGPADIAPISRGEADMGVGVHREQEGVDHPYVNEIALTGLFDITRKENSNSSDRPSDDRNSQFGLEFSMFFRSLQLGAAFEYGYGSQTTIVPTPGGESQVPNKFRTETGRYSVGPIVKFNFRNIDRNTLVPFALLGVSYTEQLTTGTGITSSGRRGTVGRIGGGVNIFLASHVAFAPRLEYVSTQSSGHGTEAGTEKSTGGRVTMLLSIFI
jgi:hypothetical protein